VDTWQRVKLKRLNQKLIGMSLENANIINRFYMAFQQKDFKTMQDCYAEDAHFSDPVFVNLNAGQVRAMWEMLCKAGKDLSLEYKILKVDDRRGEAQWTAHYTFSKTGRKVVNRIKASFDFENGSIIRHKDDFSFYNWAKQALGASGLLLGWTPFIRLKVQKAAMTNLEKFMSGK
jgi:ketosteroid isomerase-like protein